MQENSPNTTIELTEGDALRKAERKKILFFIAGFIAFNSIMFAVFIRGRSFGANLFSALNANLFGINLIGFLLGTIVALIPYKGLSYSQKYLRASLLTILVLQGLMAIGLIFIAVMRIAGWRG